VSASERRPERPERADLCPGCAHVRTVQGKNSVFLSCRRAQTDPRFPRYPPQPVVSCSGFEPRQSPGDPWP
jgi:hypothetical protein